MHAHMRCAEDVQKEVEEGAKRITSKVTMHEDCGRLSPVGDSARRLLNHTSCVNASFIHEYFVAIVVVLLLMMLRRFAWDDGCE